MNRFETFALGVAGAALAASVIGPTKLVIGGLVIAVGSYVWREYLAPKPP